MEDNPLATFQTLQEEKLPFTIQALQYQHQFSDSTPNIAMSSRVFSAADFGATAALSEDQLLAAAREHPASSTLAQLCEKLDSLRADLVKALAIQNMYHSESWRTRLWHLGPNETPLPVEVQPHLAQHRAQRLKSCQDGIGLSAQWETRLKMIIARVEVCYQLWAALGEKVQMEDVEGGRKVAREILGEQRWLRDQDGIAGVTMKMLSKHRGEQGLDCVVDRAGGEDGGRGGKVAFMWVSMR